jgi:chromosome segregation ATPase
MPQVKGCDINLPRLTAKCVNLFLTTTLLQERIEIFDDITSVSSFGDSIGERDVSVLQHQLAEVKRERRELSEQIKTINMETTSMRKVYSAYCKRSKQLKTEMEKRLGETQKKLQKAERKLQDKKLDEKEETLCIAEQRLHNMEAKLHSTEERLCDADDKLHSTEGRLHNAEQMFQDVSQKLLTSEETFRAFEREWRRELFQKEDEIGGLKNELSRVNNRLCELQRELEEVGCCQHQCWWLQADY